MRVANGLVLAAAAGIGCAAAPAIPVSAGAAVDEAVAADQAMSAACGARDAAAFAGHLSEDAVWLGREVSVGRAAVVAAWAPILAAGGPLLTWAPTSVVAAPSRDLAVSLGRFRLEPPGGGAAEEGEYLTVWRRDADGRIRAVFDAPHRPLGALPPQVRRAPLKTETSRDGALSAEVGRLFDGGRESGHYLLVRARCGEEMTLLADDGVFGVP